MHELGNTVRKLSSDVGDVKSTVDNLVESVGSKLTSELQTSLRFHRCNQARRRQRRQ